jgi:mannose-6-phosphate isomerase-like protein (cupin superfamily)
MDGLTVSTLRPENSAHCRRIDKPWGWEELWTQEGLPYVGKLLHIRAGSRLSLQSHDGKTETWLLVRGEACVLWDDLAGNLVETRLQPGRGYTCPVGQRHRLVGITECEIVEVSSPEIGTTWRFEDDFGRPHETPELRANERRLRPRPSRNNES